MSTLVGKTLRHYTILGKIGEGGMGVVYKAHDTSLDRIVALKFLPEHLTRDQTIRKRFIDEAQAASALDHPNICTIHEINETIDGQLFICMAFYDGGSLYQKISNGPLKVQEAINIFVQILYGLCAAHEKNIFHRDIKPGNILINKKDEAKIVDFGLANTNSTKGTTAYLSPEQIKGRKPDHRCDIWALGIVLYEMLTGLLPFRGNSPEALMSSIVNENPASLEDNRNDIPGQVLVILAKILKKEPDERYQKVTDIFDDLQPLLKNSYYTHPKIFNK